MPPQRKKASVKKVSSLKVVRRSIKRPERQERVLRTHVRRSLKPSFRRKMRSNSRKPSLKVRKKEKVVRYGEAKNPGPFKFNPVLLESWCITALKSDISVRAKRTELVEAAEKCEAKDGGFEVSSALYLRVFSFLRQARNPLDSTSLFSFNKALEELIKLVEKANEHVELNAQHQA